MDALQEYIPASQEPDKWVRRLAILVKLIIALTPLVLAYLEFIKK